MECLPSVTGFHDGSGQGANDYYLDIIICKWEFSSTILRAYYDCPRAGPSYILDVKDYINFIQTTPTNDQAMITKYMRSSACGRLL